MDEIQNIARYFYRGEKTCPFRCVYCFANLPSFNSALDRLAKLTTATEDSADVRLVYPSCDSEIFIDDSFINALTQLPTGEKKLVISYSTKKRLSSKEIDKISKINDILMPSGGLIKVGISVTNINSINLYEDGCSSFKDRVGNLRLLSLRGIETGVNIKPILPFIDVSEYFSVIDETIEFNKRFMLGDLYIDETTRFGDSILKNYPEEISYRTIDWLNKEMKSKVHSDLKKKIKIKDKIDAVGGISFDSDLELINDILRARA